MKLLTIMISTMNNNITNLRKVVEIQHPDICYLIIHQNHKNVSIPNFLNRDDIKIIKSSTRGLSKSRNIGLRNCRTEYALIADDDVEYIEDGIKNVLHILKTTKLDFATFKIKTPFDQPEFRDYKESVYSFSNGRIQIASIELIVNVKEVLNKKIQFDERFGLGTILRQGEEEILINDLLKLNLVGSYYPIYIVKHPFESTGTKSIKESQKFFIKGAFSKRIESKMILPKYKSTFRTLKNNLFYHLGRVYILVTKKSKY